MSRTVKIIVALGLILWAVSTVKFVKAGKQIVSSETVKVDSTLKEIKLVTPDEIQRLEDDRDRDIKVLEDAITSIKARLDTLEAKVYK